MRRGRGVNPVVVWANGVLATCQRGRDESTRWVIYEEHAHGNKYNGCSANTLEHNAIISGVSAPRRNLGNCWNSIDLQAGHWSVNDHRKWSGYGHDSSGFVLIRLPEAI